VEPDADAIRVGVAVSGEGYNGGGRNDLQPARRQDRADDIPG
jgi:hypothetical protein